MEQLLDVSSPPKSCETGALAGQHHSEPGSESCLELLLSRPHSLGLAVLQPCLCAQQQLRALPSIPAQDPSEGSSASVPALVGGETLLGTVGGSSSLVTAFTGDALEQHWTLTPEPCIGQGLSKGWDLQLLTLPSAEGSLDRADSGYG